MGLPLLLFQEGIPNMAARYIESVDPQSDNSITTIVTALKNAVANVIPFVFDADTGLGHYYDRVNSALRTLVNLDQAQTLTNKTLTSPTLSDPTITGLPVDAAHQFKTSTASFDVDSGTTGTTLTNVTGLTGITLVAGATYYFRVHCSNITMTANSGAKAAFKFTTATLTSLNAIVRQSTATDNTGAISAAFTTATDQATWFAQNAVVYTNFSIEGTMVVNAAGTVAVQLAQNASHADNTTVLAGDITAEFVRIS